MKTIKFYLAYIAVFSLILTSCSKDEATGSDPGTQEFATLTLGPVLNASMGRQQEPMDPPQCSGEDPAFAEIELIYDDGDPNTAPVLVVTVVPIGLDSEGLFTLYSEDLEIPIPSGETSVEVTLLSFKVWSDNGFGQPGEVIWIAPMEGSDFAQFVDDPLEISWFLRAGSKNYQEVEVICFDDREVNRYGYQFFDITPNPIYEFCIFANYCSDEGRHYTANYDFALYYYDGNREDGKGDMIYEGLSPMTGNDDGTFWADPLCVAVPGPGDMDDDAPYLVFEASVTDWPNYYTVDGEVESTMTILSFNDIQALLDRDGDDETVNYWHIFFNCDEQDGPSGPDLND